MTEPVNNKTLGGLTYNANLVKSAKKLNNGKFELIFKSGEKFTYPEQKPFTPKLGEENTLFNYDTDSWEVTGHFKLDASETATTGEKLPDELIAGKTLFKKGETIPRNARIEQSIDDGLIYDDTRFSITNVMGGYFTSSENTVSHVTLTNSSDTTIDLAANNSKWFADDATVKDGANNTVILDGQDTAIINNKSVEGEGSAAQKDYK